MPFVGKVQWLKRKRGSKAQKGKAFPVSSKEPLPKLKLDGIKLPKELVSAQLSEQMKGKIGYSIQPKETQTSASFKIDRFKITKDSIAYLKNEAKRRGVDFKIVMMPPEQFLRSAPSMYTIKAPAIMQTPQQFHRPSVDYAKRAIMSGWALDLPFLDFSRPKANYPLHDGRNRSQAAIELGIRQIPVAIIGERELNHRIKAA